MDYKLLVLDLDGTLTNSEKKITDPTRKALIEIQKKGIKVVLASGRPTCGIEPLAKELNLSEYGSYILSFNGGKITDCRSGEVIYNRTISPSAIPDIFQIASNYDVDILGYESDCVLSGLHLNEYTQLESRICHIPIKQIDDFCSYTQQQDNTKFLITGEHEDLLKIKEDLTAVFGSQLNIYCSEPFYLEIMPQNIDKAYSLQKLLDHMNLTREEMICCGDGFNDLTMIEFAGLGVAMANAQPVVLEKADFITKSNDEDGVLYVIEKFL